MISIESFPKTPLEFNKTFYPVCSKARSLIGSLNHALDKSGSEAKYQVKIIGWDEETKDFILKAIEYYERGARNNIMHTEHFYYKGFIGSIGRSFEYNIYYGNIQNIKDYVNYEAVSPDKLRNEFHNAVDDYLEFCKLIGKKPDMR